MRILIFISLRLRLFRLYLFFVFSKNFKQCFYIFYYMEFPSFLYKEFIYYFLFYIFISLHSFVISEYRRIFIYIGNGRCFRWLTICSGLTTIYFAFCMAQV